MENSYGLEKLDEVWGRVTSVSENTAAGTAAVSDSSALACSPLAAGGLAAAETFSAKGHDDQAALRRFIDSETRAMAAYRRLASKSGGREAKMTFNRLAGDEYAIIKKLQRFYFILTGDSFAPPAGSLDSGNSVLSALRTLYIGAEESRKEYEQESFKTSYPKLQSIYMSASGDKKRHCDMLERLIEKAIN